MPREETLDPKDEREAQPDELLDSDLEEVAGGLVCDPGDGIMMPKSPKPKILGGITGADPLP